MGQKKSRLSSRVTSPAPSPELPSSSYSVLSLPTVGTVLEEEPKHNRIRKTSSTLNVSSKKSHNKSRKLKRRPSLKKRTVEDPYVVLKEKIEREAKMLDAWVSEQYNSSQPQIPNLFDLCAMSVASRLRQSSDVVRLPLAQDLKDAVGFRVSPTFDEELSDPKVSITNEGRTLTYVGKGYSTTVIRTPFGRGLKSGRHSWLVYIDCSRVIGWMQIGVVNEERMSVDCKTVWDGNPHPVRIGEMARMSNGNFHCGRPSSERTMSQDTLLLGGYTTGDTIAVLLDVDAGTIQWMKNGEDYGHVEQLDGEIFYPSVSLDSPGESVTLAYYCGPAVL
jgi:hypothetical protein